MTLRVHGSGIMEISLDELNTAEEEILEQIALQEECPEKIRNRVSNLVRQRFRLERAILWLEQAVERQKRK